jgi:4-hydroxybenzoate polyprenyltransferase
MEISLHNHFSVLARLKLFFALSRTPHGLLDMCTPAFGALLWLGHFPPLKIVILGIITAFAGYTAVYALNDVIDYRTDRQKAAAGGFSGTESYLDGVLVRHPMAQGLLSLWQGLLWTLGWALIALIGAYLLNPVCVLIFLAGCALETVYCLLWRISPFRTVVSGVVKTSGAVAAVFAVDPQPSGWYLLILFLLLFFWGIGAQNIPADWTDIEEDRRLAAQTIPVRLGLRRASIIVVGTVVLSLSMNSAIFFFSIQSHPTVLALLSLAVSCYLLLLPAVSLYQSRQRIEATALFNRASYYPAALLAIVCIQLII